jgi:hypothetical protein
MVAPDAIVENLAKRSDPIDSVAGSPSARGAASCSASSAPTAQELEEYPECGRLEHGFLRVRCDGCDAEHLGAFGCKRRGFCPSRSALRMAEDAAFGFHTLAAYAPPGDGRARRSGQGPSGSACSLVSPNALR